MIRFAIITVSDRSSQGVRPDLSGPALAEMVIKQGWQTQPVLVVPDEIEVIRAALAELAASDEVDVILTTGGTGFAPRDVTPEATLQVIEKQAPGIAEAMRQQSLTITPHGMLSRAIAGIASSTLIVNLPGSPKAARENFEVIIPVLLHVVELLRDDPKAEAGH
ncbi:MAG: MogA/MoaB family molybdenum cofactor biosynthesis protein [Chloroflexota bacterium]